MEVYLKGQEKYQRTKRVFKIKKGKIILNKIMEKRNITEEQLKKEKPKHLDWDEMDRVADKVAEGLIMKPEGQIAVVLYDVDVDGLFSGYTLEDYLTRHNVKVERYMNKQKQHGLTNEALEHIQQLQPDWVFIVDAGSGDVSNINRLTEQGIKVVVLDHHPYENTEKLDDTTSWILNVKDKKALPELSGCGVVYRFVEKLGYMFGDLTGQYEKFVGITVLSDMCDMSIPENRYYVKRAYEEYRGNRFLQQFPFYGSGRSFYSFGVVPYLNACIRIGEEDHAMDIVNSMNNRLKMNIIDRDRKRVKTKQDNMCKEILAVSKKIVKKDVVLLLRKEKPELRPVGGLVANQLVGEYQRPALVLHREGSKWKGSLRSNGFTRQTLEENNFKTMGHDLACGVEVSNADLKEFVKNFVYEGKIEKQTATFSTTLGKLSKSTWVNLAGFNEYAGVNLPRILVRIKGGVSSALHVEEVSAKKKEIVFQNNAITDFTGKTDNTLIVEPILNGSTYQLIRI